MGPIIQVKMEMHVFVRSFVCMQGWVDSGDWTGSLVCTRQASALPLSQQLLASPVFRFLIKACLSLESIGNNEEKRKCVYVLRSDSDQLTERLPDPTCILQSLPTRLLSVPQLPSCALFILASQRLGLSHQALYDLLLFFPCLFYMCLVPKSLARRCVSLWEGFGLRAGHVSWTLSLIWQPGYLSLSVS